MPLLLKGRLQSNYKFVLKVEVLYADIPAKNDLFQKFMFWPPEAKRYKYLTISFTPVFTFKQSRPYSYSDWLNLTFSQKIANNKLGVTLACEDINFQAHKIVSLVISQLLRIMC